MSKLALQLIEKAKKSKSKSLDLGNCDLVKLPDELYKLIWLEELILSSQWHEYSFETMSWKERISLNKGRTNNIEGFSNKIGALKDLKILICSSSYGNKWQLRDLNPLGNLTELEVLDLGNTKANDLTPLSKMPNLRMLDLRNTSTSILTPLKTLHHLEYLNLSTTQVQDLMPLSQHKQLKYLDLNNSLVFDISPLRLLIANGAIVKRLISIGHINIDNCQITNPPIEIIEQGNEAILDFFRQQDAQGTDYIFEAKGLIIGKPRVGKTSLALKIQKMTSDLPKFEATTKGIDVYRWHFDISEQDVKHLLVGKNTQEITRIKDTATQKGFWLNIWDFGGQEIYTATHQFFLTKRSLYLMVDAEILGEDTNWYDWLYRVSELSNGSPLLVIINKISGRNWSIPDWDSLIGIFSFIRNPVFNINLDCKSDEDQKIYYQLLNQIKRELLSFQHIGTPYPVFWVELRQIFADKSEELKRTNKQPVILENEFFNICAPFRDQDSDFNQAAQLRMSQYFHDIGIYLHFQDDETLKNFLFLDANWTTNLVYMLLDDEIVRNKKGRFNQQDIDRIWDENEYRSIKDYLIHLLRQFSIAYLVDKVKKEYVTPYHLSPYKPKYELVTDKKILLEMHYKFGTFMPKGILPQLIVSLSEYITDHRKVWLKGVVLVIPQHKTTCEIEETYTKSIIIKIWGQDGRETLAIIKDHIEKIIKPFARLDKDEFIRCNCLVCQKLSDQSQRSFYSYKMLKDKLSKGSQTVECPNDNYSSKQIVPMLDEVFDSNPINEGTISQNQPFIQLNINNQNQNSNTDMTSSKKNDSEATMWGWLSLAVVILGLLLTALYSLDVWKSLIFIAGGVILCTLFGALHLKSIKSLKDEDFMNLVKMIFSKIPPISFFSKKQN